MTDINGEGKQSEQIANVTRVKERRLLLTRAVMSVLDSWGVNAADCVRILGLPEKTQGRMLRRYRDNTPFPESDDLDERLDHLVGIAEALRTTFPRNAQMGSSWMVKPHRRFNRQSPLSVILEGGLSGLINVRTHLDCAFGWERTN